MAPSATRPRFRDHFTAEPEVLGDKHGGKRVRMDLDSEAPRAYARRRTTLGRISEILTPSRAPRRAQVTAPAPGQVTTQSGVVLTTTPEPRQSVVASTTTERGPSRSVGPARASTRPPSAYITPRPPPVRSRQNSRSGSQVGPSRPLVSPAPSRRGSQARARNASRAPSAVLELPGYDTGVESAANYPPHRSAPYPSSNYMPTSSNDSDSAVEPRPRARRRRGATRQASATPVSVAPPRRTATAPAASASSTPLIPRKPLPPGARSASTPTPHSHSSCPDGSKCLEPDRPWQPRTPLSWGKWSYCTDITWDGMARWAMRCQLPEAARAVDVNEWEVMPPFAQDLYSLTMTRSTGCGSATTLIPANTIDRSKDSRPGSMRLQWHGRLACRCQTAVIVEGPVVRGGWRACSSTTVLRGGA
ncbi:hypothetical protein B0T18DRAFT_163751 [Schizothecium vesticola]|uniref:Uncharacterized protein n=1 Tax=Schizothecium vesticola TaxID=314040 RepID=A0AA40EWS2_9PEZI|nr:hypothetical protein B0T18DRAFT_163751 [Schizothecium vesticola]